MEETINICESVKDEYLYHLNAKDNNVVLEFQNLKLIFNSFLIFKNGYPNEEAFSTQKLFRNNDLKLSTLYQISNSLWIEEIKKNNQVHPRHKDEIFDRFRHFIIFFSDESFECISKSYEIKKLIDS